jgi:hypothetical protein
MDVKANMLKCSDRQVYPVNPDTVITRLYYGEQIQLTAVATVGKGKDHAKWSPVAGIGYNIHPVEDRYKIHLTIESVGSLSPNYILSKAKSLVQCKDEND